MADVGQEGKSFASFTILYYAASITGNVSVVRAPQIMLMSVLCRGLRSCESQGVEDWSFCLLR
jgi:hypothetical protein